MKILVLDTIHGGKSLAEFLENSGHNVDYVDVYRALDGTVTEEEAAGRTYDLITAPVHLDPSSRLLNYSGTKIISHHEAVRMAANVPENIVLIEITGGQGKTTTAQALAHIMNGRGILHTSRGTVYLPENTVIFKKSITPATLSEVISAVEKDCSWIIAEESIGVTGLGDLGILTSGIDYPIANGKKSALNEKIRLIKGCSKVLIAPGTNADIPESCLATDIVRVKDDVCIYDYMGIRGEFKNSLLTVEGYREALMTAAAAGCILGTDPGRLGSFSALKGRLSYSYINKTAVIDNSNSGTNRNTTIAASRYAERIIPGKEQVLVIGVEADNICEGFPDDEIAGAITDIMPASVVVISKYPYKVRDNIPTKIEFDTASSFEEGSKKAIETGEDKTVILSVKTWR